MKFILLDTILVTPQNSCFYFHGGNYPRFRTAALQQEKKQNDSIQGSGVARGVRTPMKY